MARITKRLVEGLRPETKDYWVWDGDIPGFGVRVWPSGRKVYMAQYRAAGRTRRVSLGVHGAVTPHQARKTALDVLAAVNKGENPAEARASNRKDPTIAEFSQRYLSDHATVKKKPKSVAQDRRMLEKIILPKLGRVKLTAVDRSDVARLHNQLRQTPYQANRCLALLSKMFNLAERWGLRPDGSNPCRHVEKFKEAKRERFLTPDELGRLGAALSQAEASGESPYAVAAIKLLLLTGARLNEILTLKWSMMDFETACLRLEDSKTGKRTIQLNGPALEVLAAIPHEYDNPHVIVGNRPGGHWVNLSKPWRRISAMAGLEGVRIHDLRHSHASIAAAAGLGLPIIGALLGHTQPATTQRYAHLADDPLRAASEEVGRRIAEALSKPSMGKVVPLRRNE